MAIITVQFTRDWFLTRFRLLADDILVEQEKRIRKYKFWENSKHLSAAEAGGVDHLAQLLAAGVQVNHHLRSGRVEPAVLKLDARSNTLILQALNTPVISFWAQKPLVSVLTILVELLVDGDFQ